MAREFTQRIFDSVQSGLNSTVQTIQAAVSQPHQLGSAFYPSTLDQMENVKSGWLRKQGGIVRSWHRRYFVLKGDYIYYYTTQEEFAIGRPPLGSIFLPGNHVVEIPYNSTDTEKFQFEIQSGDRVRMSPTHESYLFSAESEDERKDWMRAIKRMLYSMAGGAIFGQSLEETMKYELLRDRLCKIPYIVSQCISYLRQFGLQEEGLFRLPGRTVVIRQLTELYDRGERIELKPNCLPDSTLDVHTVASLLKSYLRELPEPLVPFSAYESVIRVITREMPVIGEDAAVVMLGRILNAELPPANYNTIQFVSHFLHEVSLHSDVNKMNIANLATVFVQCFVQPDADDDPTLMLATSMNRTLATQIMISRCKEIFNLDYTPDGNRVAVGDLLGLNSSMNSMSEMNSSCHPTAAIDLGDLEGLDLNKRRSECLDNDNEGSVTLRQRAVRRSNIVTMRQSTNRVGIVDSGKTGREAVANGMNGINSGGGKLTDIIEVSNNHTLLTHEVSAPTQLQTHCHTDAAPVSYRSVRSDILETTSSATAPVAKPRPTNFQPSRAGNSGNDLKAQMEQLQSELKSVTRERDDARARITALEEELCRFRAMYGPLH